MTASSDELRSVFDSIAPPTGNGKGVAASLASAIAEAMPASEPVPAPPSFERRVESPAPFASAVEELPSWTPAPSPEPAPPPELPPSPPPPVVDELPPSPAPPALVDDDLDWEDVDAGFDAIQTAPGSSGALADDRDRAAVEELFKQIAATQVVPVRDFAVELSLGEASTEWYPVCIPALVSLRRSAEEMGIASMMVRLDEMLDVLRAGESAGTGMVRGQERDGILAAYDALAAELPTIPSASEERDRREPIMVQALLRQVPGVRDVAIDKLFSAGLTRLDFYYRATPREIADTSGVPYPLAEAIVSRFSSYRDRQTAIRPESKRIQDLRELEALTRALEQHNRAYDNGASGWTAGAEESRRHARKQRTEAVLGITLLLARLGEVDMVAQLERLPFDRKVRALDTFITASLEAERTQKHRGQSS